jgi:hypothetical protein
MQHKQYLLKKVNGKLATAKWNKFGDRNRAIETQELKLSNCKIQLLIHFIKENIIIL